MNNFIANQFSIYKMLKSVCQMFKMEDIFYNTLKCQLENPASHLWLNRLLLFYGYIGTVRMSFASYCHYYGYWSLIDGNLKRAIDIFIPINHLLICFVLLNFYSVWELQLFLCINKSINGDFMQEIVVDNVEDFNTRSTTLLDYP